MSLRAREDDGRVGGHRKRGRSAIERMLGVAIPAFGIMAAPPPADGQEIDTLLVEVRLEGGENIVVVAEKTPQVAEIRLPAAPIFQLAGLGEPTVPTITPADLERMLGVEAVWVPSQLLVVIRDPRRALPVTVRRDDEARARAQFRSAIEPEQRQGGPFFALTADDRRESLLEVGYSWKGLVASRVSRSSLSGVDWSVGASPVERLWLSYSDGEERGASVNLRLAQGRAWVAVDYENEDEDLDLSGATALGPLILYASTRDQAVVTWRGPIDVQVGRSASRSSVRVSYGPIDPSPLSVPLVR